MRNLHRISHLKNKLTETVPGLLRETDNEILCVALNESIICELYFATKEGLFRGFNLKGGQWDDPDLPERKAEGLLPDEQKFLNVHAVYAKLRKHHRCKRGDDEFRGDIETLLRGDAGYTNIIAIEHLFEFNVLCCASSDGNVWSYNLNTGAVQEVAHFQHGIEAMQWNLDHDEIVFVDKKLNVITMTGRTYQKISEVQLKDGSDSKHSTKKPTKSRKADDRQKGSKNEFDESVEKDPYTCISWEADGNFFAVSFKAPGGPRAFKVFNKEGALQYTSEPCRDLYSAIAWHPINDWIAMPQLDSEDVFVIALFEKNGERRQEIDTCLYLESHELVSLCWSPDGEVLAVLWYTTGAEICSHVFLYAKHLGIWYLKQCLSWPGNIYGVQWEQVATDMDTLHLLTNALCYERIRCEFRVDRSVGHGKDDDGIVAIIDGFDVCLSSCRRSIIPEPMCCFTLTPPESEAYEEEKYINAVGFIRSPGRWASVGQDVSPNAFFVVDSNNRITFYDVTFTEEGKDDSAKIMGVKTLLSLPPYRDLSERIMESSDSLIHWLWVNPEHVVLCCNNYLVSLNLAKSGHFGEQRFYWIENEKMEPFMADEIIACVEPLGPDSVLIELSSGRLMRVEGFTVGQPGVESFSIKLHSTLPEFCEQLFIDQKHSAADVYAFSRFRCNLYRNGTLLAPEVTSVFLSEDYLVFIKAGELKFVALGDKRGRVIDGGRRLEFGTEIVTVVPKTSRIIFQLWDKLEENSHHVLSLCLIAKHLEALEYHDAFDVMRKERINLNLLVDHNPEWFLAHMDTHFLVQITNVSWLNLFITDLTNQDVCRTMYESNYPGRQESAGCLPSSSGYTVEAKVQFICERLLGAMDSDPTVLTLPKITCHVKQGQLEKALSLIWVLKRDKSTPEPAEEALRYLFSLVEVNALYDAALGLYDLELARYVTTKSKKDKKKYLPFLNELKRLDEHERKYRIDCHLKRYDRVVVNISRCEVDESRLQEVLELIDTHNLYTLGINCYRTSSNAQFLLKIYERYAEHLRKFRKHVEASLMYERIGDIQQAINSARHALDWRRVLRLGARSTDPQAVRLVLRSLVPALVEAAEYDAAATIAHEHLKDIRLAIDCLLKGPRYEQALLMVASGGPDASELYETIRDHLRQYLSSFITTLAADREQFLHQAGRLQAARVNQEKPTLPVTAVGEKKISPSRGRSRKSQRSMWGRRKRRWLNPKEANPADTLDPFEALHALVLRTCSVVMQRNVRSICQVALELRFDAEAQTIQRDYGALFDLISRSLDFIWITLQGLNVQPVTPKELNHRCKPVIQAIEWQLDILK